MKTKIKALIDTLELTKSLESAEYLLVLEESTPEDQEYLFSRARAVREREYGKDIYIRGLIEISNYCKNNCYYCGIRAGNDKVERYRLSKEDILDCCAKGGNLGFRTFVLQGGEDPFFTAEHLADIVENIKKNHPNCAVTLSVGERTRENYRLLKEAGADRFLLRHETANPEHYQRLHPKEMTLSHRKSCLEDLKELGFQVGTGFMVGSPFQRTENLVEDLEYIEKLQPAMVGIGPYLPHKDTPFRDQPAGSAQQTVVLLAMLRLMLPKALLPATTSLATVDLEGTNLGFLAGANVIMPNLSPATVREKYMLYDNKKNTGTEAAESLRLLSQQVERLGYRIAVHRGDAKR